MSEMKIMRYARVSSMGQNLDRQIQALKGPLGLRRGDTLIITSLDCLSRSKSDIKTELVWFEESGIRLMVLDLPTTMIELPDGQTWIQEKINNILIEVMQWSSVDLKRESSMNW